MNLQDVPVWAWALLGGVALFVLTRGSGGASSGGVVSLPSDPAALQLEGERARNLAELAAARLRADTERALGALSLERDRAVADAQAEAYRTQGEYQYRAERSRNRTDLWRTVIQTAGDVTGAIISRPRSTPVTSFPGGSPVIGNPFGTSFGYR